MSKDRKIMLFFDLSRKFSRDLLKGVAKYSRLNAPWHTYRLAEFYWEPGHKRIKKELKLLKDWGTNGIITREMNFIEELLDLDIPVIGCDTMDISVCENISYITENYKETGKIAAEHLLNKGFRNFAFFGFSDVHWSLERKKGFCNRIQQAGYVVYVYEKPLSKIRRLWKNEINLMSKWLKQLPLPLGVMACSDGRSQHLVEACKITEIQIPEQIALISVDNDELVCDISSPTLSSICLNTETAGYESALLLDKMIDDGDMRQHKIIIQPTHVKVRHSTDVMAIEDRFVVAALNFIRKNSRELIQVTEVADSAGCSRRSLEVKFKRILGRSVLDEIKRVRVGEMATMLIETDYSLKKIAMTLGYHSLDNVTRYFRQQAGMTPREYRKKYSQTIH